MKKDLPERLRVCFTSQRFSQSATDEHGYLIPLTKSLAARGHDVTVITTQPFPGGSKDGVQIHHIEQESFLDRLEQLHVERPFDLIHSVDNSGFHAALHKKELKTAVATDVSVAHLDQIFGILGLTEDTILSYIRTSWVVGFKFLRSLFGAERKFLRLSDGIFVASPQQEDILERYYYIPSRKVHIIPYGLDAKKFDPLDTRAEVFEELGIEPGTKLILTITPMLHAEETKNLLTAFERVVIKKPKTALIIVGDGPKRKDLEFHMLSLALASKVHFTGEITGPKLNSVINACDVFVNLYSKSSGFEPTVLEAMACCKTVIASEVGTASHVIENGDNGFLIRPTEIGALSRLLFEIVAEQIDTAPIGEKARQKVLKMFDTEQMVDETIEAYHDILVRTGKYRR